MSLPESTNETISRMATAIREMSDTDLLAIFALARAGRAAQVSGEPQRMTAAPKAPAAPAAAPKAPKPKAPPKPKTAVDTSDPNAVIQADPLLLSTLQAVAQLPEGAAVADVVRITGAEKKPPTARALKKLVSLGALEKHGEKRYTRYYVAGRGPSE